MDNALAKEVEKCEVHYHRMADGRCCCPHECADCGTTYRGPNHSKDDCITVLKRRLRLDDLAEKIKKLEANQKPMSREDLVAAAKADLLANLPKPMRPGTYKDKFGDIRWVGTGEIVKPSAPATELCTRCQQPFSSHPEPGLDCYPDGTFSTRWSPPSTLVESPTTKKCTCPESQWIGSEPNDSTCELSEEEHQQIAQPVESSEELLCPDCGWPRHTAAWTSDRADATQCTNIFHQAAPAFPEVEETAISLIREMLTYRHYDPNVGRGGTRKWVTLNLRIDLWKRLEAIVAQPLCTPPDTQQKAVDKCLATSKYGCICLLDAGHEGKHDSKCGWNHNKWEDASDLSRNQSIEES